MPVDDMFEDYIKDLTSHPVHDLREKIASKLHTALLSTTNDTLRSVIVEIERELTSGQLLEPQERKPIVVIVDDKKSLTEEKLKELQKISQVETISQPQEQPQLNLERLTEDVNKYLDNLLGYDYSGIRPIVIKCLITGEELPEWVKVMRDSSNKRNPERDNKEE